MKSQRRGGDEPGIALMRRLVDRAFEASPESPEDTAPIDVATPDPGGWRALAARWREALPCAATLLLAVLIWRVAGTGLIGWAVGLGMDDERGALMASLIVAAVAAGIVAASTGARRGTRIGGVLAVVAVQVGPFLVRGSRTHPTDGLAARVDVRGFVMQPLGMVLLALLVVSLGAAAGLLLRGDVAALIGVVRRRRAAWAAVAAGIALAALAAAPAMTAVQDGPISDLYDYSATPVSAHNEAGNAPLAEARHPGSAVLAGTGGSGDGTASAGSGRRPGSAASIAAASAATAQGGHPGSVESMTVDGHTALVYVPGVYQQDASHHYPVLYFLHGYPGNPDQWVGSGAQLPQVLDQLIDVGAIPPLLVVMPNGNGTAVSDAEWGDTARGDHVEDWVAGTLVPAVDARYRTLGARFRGIAGLSAGGFGAVNLSLHHPDLFRWAASYSGYFTGRHDVFGAATPANTPALLAGRLGSDARMPLYVGIGDQDTEFGVDNHHFVTELASLGWPAAHSDTVPGGHGWEAWRLEIVHSLRWLSTLWGTDLAPMQSAPPLAAFAPQQPPPTPEPSPSATPAPTRTPKPAPSPTSAPTQRPAPTPTPTPQPTPTPTPKDTPSPSPSGHHQHPSPTPDPTPSPSPNESPSPKTTPS
ncbi:MAG TPA: alpha/beta hydrolase-fold protein [Candidatus Dormibacteraeota bacterium]